MINEQLSPEDIDVEKHIVTEEPCHGGSRDIISSISTNETSSRGPSSEKNSVTEITSLTENLILKNDQLEKMSTETGNMEVLYQIVDYEGNFDFESDSSQKNDDIESSSDERDGKMCGEDKKILSMIENALKNRRGTFALKIIKGTLKDLLKVSTGVSRSVEEEEICGKDKKKLSMIENALKNGQSTCAIEMIKGSIKDLLEISTKGYENKSTLRSPEKDMYLWASRCDRVNRVHPRCQLQREGVIQVFWDKFRSAGRKFPFSQFFNFKPYRLHLNKGNISMENVQFSRQLKFSVKYGNILNVKRIVEKSPRQKYILELELSEGTFVLQLSSSYLQHQWYHSILWRTQILKYHNIFRPSTDILTTMAELQNFVNFVVLTPIEDHDTHTVPIYMISKLFREIEVQLHQKLLEQEYRECIIVSVSPLFKSHQPSLEMCNFFSDHFCKYPLSFAVQNVIYESVRHILMHQMDDAQYPFLRKLVQDYINVLSYQNNASEAIKLFVARIHGSNYNCPHLKIMNNLTSSCIAAIGQWFKKCSVSDINSKKFGRKLEAPVKAYRCHLMVLRCMSEYDDWLPDLARMLQPNSFPTRALNCEHFVRAMGYILQKTMTDSDCSTHSQILGSVVKQYKWFDVYCPTNGICQDGGQLWSSMIDILLNCCKKGKSFLLKLYNEHLEACLALALKENLPCQKALYLMLERNIAKEHDRKILIIATLRSIENGRIHFM